MPGDWPVQQSLLLSILRQKGTKQIKNRHCLEAAQQHHPLQTFCGKKVRNKSSLRLACRKETYFRARTRTKCTRLRTICARNSASLSCLERRCHPPPSSVSQHLQPHPIVAIQGSLPCCNVPLCTTHFQEFCAIWKVLLWHGCLWFTASTSSQNSGHHTISFSHVTVRRTPFGRAASHHHITTQHSTAQHSTAQHSTAQHSTAQHSTAQHSTAQHSTAQHSTAQHSTAQHSTATATSHHITSHHITPCHMTLHDTTRHDTTGHDMTRHDTTRHDMTWHDMTWHGTRWHVTTPCHITSEAVGQRPGGTKKYETNDIIPHRMGAHHVTTTNTPLTHNQPPPRHHHQTKRRGAGAYKEFGSGRALSYSVLAVGGKVFYSGVRLHTEIYRGPNFDKMSCDDLGCWQKKMLDPTSS